MSQAKFLLGNDGALTLAAAGIPANAQGRFTEIEVSECLNKICGRIEFSAFGLMYIGNEMEYGTRIKSIGFTVGNADETTKKAIIEYLGQSFGVSTQNAWRQ